tara:strand:+ start:611 stop:2956 length:2346 start_codon:yes stop_codon:yes gene_type:complete
MPTTPKIVTRSETTSSNSTQNLNKGSKLTFAEMDSNFIELRNGSIGVVGDDSTGIDIAHGSTLNVVGAGGIATAVSGDTLTIDGSNLSSLGDLTAIGSTLVSPSNAAITLDPSGTGTIELNADTNVTGTLTATTLAGTLSTAAQTNVTSLGTLSALQVDNINVNGNTITSTSSTIDLFTTGHQNINIGSNTGTGDGTASTTVEGIEFKKIGTTHGTWLNIPMSYDGSTSQDVEFRTRSDGAPELYFNNTGDAAGRFRVASGSLTISAEGSNSTAGNIRIEAAGTLTLDANTINLGGDTVVVSGNKISTDSSNEDLELEANGAGNISLLSPANMNSNKITNVTDPTAAQDAATKAYVDSQTHLTPQGITVVGDDSTGTLISDGETVTIAGGTGITTAMSGDVLTITGNVGTVTASSTDTFTNKTFDANGTGNNISNIDIANMTAASIVLESEGIASNDNDTTLPTSAAVKDYVDDQTADLTGTVQFDAKATEAITKGEAVYIAGISGNTPTVTLARANASSTMPAFGIAAADIAQDATGKITTFGSLTGLDVSDFGETSITFALGDTIYISSSEAGKLTNVAPTGESNFIQNIGKIERHTPTSNMTIKVGGAGRTNATPALDDGNIFIGNGSNQSSTVALADQVKNYKAVTLVGDDSTGTNINIGETFRIAGGDNITTAVSGDTLTITGAAGGSANTGDITFVGSTMISPSNADITLNPAGTGKVNINAVYTLPNADGSANQVLGTNGSGVLSFVDPTAINIDGGVADTTYTSVPTIDGGTA